ncbi:MAG: TRAP transporter small permease [Synergistaceae bacterium]|jgi:TRAP-type C4-dicarboxylate transport system permease small subunit|nr:TRAP transporter small permease [Synergistaceae bacterium]
MIENSGATLLMRASDRINSVCEVILFAILALMTFFTILQIVCRMWFKALTWSEEITCFLLVFASFFGICVAFKRGANITVNFLRDALPQGPRRLLLMAIEAVGMIFFAVTGWFGGALCVSERFQTASSLPISMSWIYLIFPLSSVIAILHLAARLEELIRFPDTRPR